MKPPVLTLVVCSVFLAACAGRPTPKSPAPPPPPAKLPASFLPVTPYSGGDGTSLANAVVIKAGSDAEGVHLENEWIFHKYGRFRKPFAGMVAQNGHHFDVITAEFPDGTRRTIYFDITWFFGRDDPSPR